MGQPGSVGAVEKGIQERKYFPWGFPCGFALAILWCPVCDWLMSLGDKGILEQWKRHGSWGPGRGGFVEVQRNVSCGPSLTTLCAEYEWEPEGAWFRAGRIGR